MTGTGGTDLDQVRQGLRMAAPPDPGQLVAERAELAALAAQPFARRLRGYWRFVGPGFLQSAMTLGSGTAANCLFAGAVFGYQLLWVAPLGMLLGVLVMAVIAHQTLSTQARPLAAMAQHGGRWLAIAWAGAAVLASIVWHFPQYNLAASALVDAAEAVGHPGLHPGWASAFVLGWAIVLSLLYGKSPALVKRYERVLKYIVWSIVLSLLWVVVHTDTDWAAVARGFVPQVPAARNGIGGVEIAVSGIAAAVGINMVLLYPYSLLARGWGREHRGLARFDLATGMFVPYVLASSLLVIAAANTLHQGGADITTKASVKELANVLGTVIGPLAGRLLFDLGMVAMALSTITLHMLVCGFVAMEGLGLPFGSIRQRLFTLLPIPGALAPFFWGEYAVYLAVPTTIVCGAMLPIAYLGFLRLQRAPAYLGADRQRGPWASAVLVVAMLVVVVSLVSYLWSELA